jgi:protein MBA1
MSKVSKYLLTPILENFNSRIGARDDGVKMDWQLLGGMKAKVMSHRCSVFGEEQPDTAFRQVVVRIKSTQRLRVDYNKEAAKEITKSSTSKVARGFAPQWAPLDVKKQQQIATTRKSAPKEKKEAEMKSNVMTKEVVEYLVLQRRVKSGIEDKEWKVWGFTQESTPDKIAEDEEYWRKTLAATA